MAPITPRLTRKDGVQPRPGEDAGAEEGPRLGWTRAKKSFRGLAHAGRVQRQLVLLAPAGAGAGAARRPGLGAGRARDGAHADSARGHIRSLALLKPEKVLEGLESMRALLLSRSGRKAQAQAQGDKNPSSDSLTIDSLVELKYAFDEADTDGSGALDEEEFIEAFMSVPALAKFVNTEALQHLFMKIDANSDGTVDWDEFTNHLMFEQARKLDFERGDADVTYERVNPATNLPAIRGAGELPAVLAQGGASDGSANDAHAASAKFEPVTCICHLPTISCYVTGALDGTMRTWSYSMKPVRVVRKFVAMVTAMAQLGTQPLAVACMDRSITFFDAHRPGLEVLARIFALSSVPVSLHWLSHKDNDFLLYGDERGSVHMYVLEDAWGTMDANELVEEGFEVTKKPFKGTRQAKGFRKLHSDWVTKMLYIEKNDTLITSSKDGTIKATDFSKHQVKWTARAHPAGVNSFVYCRSFNFIVTCGDRNIHILDPFTGKKTNSLIGHSDVVVDIRLNENETLLLSVSSDKVLRVWDIRMYKCIGMYVDKEIHMPENKFFAMEYNPMRKTVLLASSRLVMYKRKLMPHKVKRTLSTGLYNTQFRQLVTASVDSAIQVWAVDHGEAVFSFENVHGKASITAATFDSTGRRLVTGSIDGQVRTWNFNNGQQLGEFEGFGEEEVSCVAYTVEGPNNFILAGGWNRRVCIWSDDETFAHSAPLRSFTRHAEDVTSMCVCGGATSSIVASGDYDGVVFLWRLDCSPKHELRAVSLENAPSGSRQALSMRSFSGYVGPKKSAHGNFAKDAFAVLYMDNRLRLWRTTDGSLLIEIDLFGASRKSVEPMSLDIDLESLTAYVSDDRGGVTPINLSTLKYNAPADKSLRAPGSAASAAQAPLLSSELARIHPAWQAQMEKLIAVCFVAGYRLVIVVGKSGDSRLYTADGVYVGHLSDGDGWNIAELVESATANLGYTAVPAFDVKANDNDADARIASPKIKSGRSSWKIPSSDLIQRNVDMVISDRALQKRREVPKLAAEMRRRLSTHGMSKRTDPSEYINESRAQTEARTRELGLV